MCPGCTHQGADFVDVILGIMVQNATDSILAFQPCHCHAITQCNHVEHGSLAFTFSKHILDAYNQAVEKGYVPEATFTWGSHKAGGESVVYSHKVNNPGTVLLIMCK